MGWEPQGPLKGAVHDVLNMEIIAMYPHCDMDNLIFRRLP